MKNSSIRTILHLSLSLFLGLLGALFLVSMLRSETLFAATPIAIGVMLAVGVLVLALRAKQNRLRTTLVTTALLAIVVQGGLLWHMTPPPAQAATFTVTRFDDTLTCVPGDCSLRGATIAANATGAPDTILINTPGVYSLTLTAGSGEDAGELDITSDTTIRAISDGVIIDSTAVNERVLFISGNNIDVLLENLTFQNGQELSFDGGAIAIFGNTSSTVTIRNSRIINNVTGNEGGGIYANGPALILENTLVASNTSTTSHGGGMEVNGSTVTIRGSTFSNNESSKNGGAIRTRDNIEITNSTFSGNRANRGGALEILGGTVTLNNVTITDNSSKSAGGFRPNGGSLTTRNSIISRNFNSNNGATVSCDGTYTSEGYNVLGNGCNVSTTGDQTNITNPQLEPLAYNGGSTPTHAPADGSPVIDGGSPDPLGSGGTSCETTDQRGFDRSAPCEVGAYEVRGTVLQIDKDTLTPDAVPGGTTSYAIRVRNAGSAEATGVVITDTLPTGFTFNSNSNLSEPTGLVTRTTTTDPTSGATSPVWSGWNIAPGGELIITFTVDIDISTAENTYQNTAFALSNETGEVNDTGSFAQDPDTIPGEDPGNDEDVTVTRAPVLTINKETSTPNVPPGGTATYSIVVQNTGLEPATGVTITDTLPSGFTFDSGSISNSAGVTRTVTSDPTSGSSTPAWGVWSIAPGSSLTVNFDAAVATTVITGTYNNSVSVDSNETNIVSDDGSDTDEDVSVGAVPTPGPGPNGLFLPTLFKSYAPPRPDLVVDSVSVSGGNVTIILRNQGTAPVTQEFWVDLYVNPNPPPTGVNDVWNDGRSARGAAWGVTAPAVPIPPGGTVTLSSNDLYFRSQLSNLTGVRAGAAIYVQVDSANQNSVLGAVTESHEVNGLAYNNILGPVSSTGVLNVEETDTAARQDSSGLPPR